MTATQDNQGIYSPVFPEHPEDGHQIIETLDDGRQLLWTYNEALNAWNPQIISPDAPATEGWVIEQGYVQGPVRTKDVPDY